MRHLLLLVLIASAAGCLRNTEFQCMVDGDCSASGSVCETTSYCSFVDTECTSGRRYGELSGPFANQCVGDQTTLDGGVDSPTDTGGNGCPAGYATLPNAGTHVYKLTADAQNWSTQYARCIGDGAYLAIPDDATELMAITTAGGAARTWVGIDDRTAEGTFVTSKGMAATFLPWASGEPNNGGNQDCVAALMASPNIATDSCDQNMFPAVCECEP